MLRIRQLDANGDLVEVPLPLEYYQETVRIQDEIIANYELMWKGLQDYARAIRDLRGFGWMEQEGTE